MAGIVKASQSWGADLKTPAVNRGNGILLGAVAAGKRAAIASSSRKNETTREKDIEATISVAGANSMPGLRHRPGRYDAVERRSTKELVLFVKGGNLNMRGGEATSFFTQYFAIRQLAQNTGTAIIVSMTAVSRTRFH
ncbi:hypothetical protein [Paraburkholderia fynbosensis]|uniref:Uncharacterized protein n=1 Tax=Paraburkholderia fynbosensis TaxID=1200993 RepID=A0A6J5H1E0_9BURK|nr:hypothetical protein [Paraburkholderia fynbosensis]CAB3810063.1 hypothetical protein LMG27177_07027 [Paraburkholderia fynbosensis]